MPVYRNWAGRSKCGASAWVSGQAELNNFHPISHLPVIAKTLMKTLYMCTWSTFGLSGEEWKVMVKPSSDQIDKSMCCWEQLMTQSNPGKRCTHSTDWPISKASDSIKHDLLLRKLYDYGITKRCRVGMVHWLSVKEGWYWTMFIRSGPGSAWVLLRDPLLDHLCLCYLWPNYWT